MVLASFLEPAEEPEEDEEEEEVEDEEVEGKEGMGAGDSKVEVEKREVCLLMAPWWTFLVAGDSTTCSGCCCCCICWTSWTCCWSPVLTLFEVNDGSSAATSCSCG